MSTTVPVDAPWEAAERREWDGQTLETVGRGPPGQPDVHSTLVPIATRPIFGAEPGELSLLFTLFYIAASGNEKQPGHVRAQLQHPRRRPESRFVGGSQLIALKIAKKLGQPGGARRAGAADRAGQDRRPGRLRPRDRSTPSEVIVAIPPALAARIYYEPKLPVRPRPADPAHAPGHADQGRRVYDKPFWRDKGLNGTASSTRPAHQRDRSTTRRRAASRASSSASSAATRPDRSSASR